MKKVISTNRSRKSGFTLVELIIVIAVIGVLAAILIPVFSNVINKANSKSALSDARNAVSLYMTEAMERKLLGEYACPENVVIIVQKGGRFYTYGFNTAVAGAMQVSDANEQGMAADDLDALISSYSWNAHNAGGTYDPSVTYTESDGYFYLVPYTGITPANDNVRGFASAPSTGEIYHRLDDYEIGGLNLNIGNDTVLYHGCLVNGTYDTQSTSASDNTPAPSASPAASADPSSAPVTHTVTFAVSGMDNADRSNVIIKQNGTAVTGNSATVADGTIVASFTAEYPYNENTDDHWYTLSDTTPASGIITSDITLTFNFVRIDMHQLKFVMGQGETFRPAAGASASMKLRKGTDITSYVTGSSAETTAQGQNFSRWEKQGDASVKYYPTSTNIVLTGDLTLVPKFEAAQLTVTYKSGTGAAGSDKIYTVDYGTNGTTKAFADMGWTLDSGKAFFRWNDGHNSYGENAPYTFTSDVTFTAAYSSLYTVSYNANGGSGTMSAHTDIVGGETINLRANGFTAPAHKHFTGWRANNTGSLLTAAQAYTVNSDVTMYAQWENDTSYTVSYNKNTTDSVSGMPSDDTGVYAGAYTLSTATPTRTGYTFMGWATSSGSTTTVTSVTVSGNTTVYAVWQIKSYTVTFTDGASSQNKSYNYNTTITLADENPLSAPTGKELDKFTVGGADATTLTVTANATVTVVWKDVASTPTEEPHSGELVVSLKFVNVTGLQKPSGNDQATLQELWATNGIGQKDFYESDIARYSEELDYFARPDGKYRVKVADFTTVFPNYPKLGNDDTEYAFTGAIDWSTATTTSVIFGRNMNGGTDYYKGVIVVTPSTSIHTAGESASTNVVTYAAILPVPYEDR